MIDFDFGEPLHCIIIPFKLHQIEAEYLVEICGAPEEILEGYTKKRRGGNIIKIGMQFYHMTIGKFIGKIWT